MTYPPVSRREVAEQLGSDPVFVRRCVRLLQQRTVAKAGGFMASHRHKAAALMAVLDAVDDRELLDSTAWLAVYARSLSHNLP
jgi:hypothetical protein